jgi:hypothetical protein
MSSDTPEHIAYSILHHWKPVHQIIPAKKLMNESSPCFPLFNYLYDYTRSMYTKVPRRKNGEDPFIHPINVVRFLSLSEVAHEKIDDAALICGLIHDIVEEKVDIYRKENDIKDDPTGLRLSGNYEKQSLQELQELISTFCSRGVSKTDCPETIVPTVNLLTRYKRHSYYTYVSNIFECKDPAIKERAIRVKLADRIHNVLCIESFNEKERIYQCFKNLFILNNTKKFLIEKYGEEMFTGKVNNVTEKLFNKCIKATYDAFLKICYIETAKGTADVNSMIQLAFKKFALLRRGLNIVTDFNDEEPHPMKLFQGVVRKYDARLHYEWDVWNERLEKELDYVTKFFSEFNFTKEQLQGVVDYKDAYALKEVLTLLLYKPSYFLQKFVASDLSKKGRIINK